MSAQERTGAGRSFRGDIRADVLPGRALDLGCGTGTDSIYLAQQGWHVTGIDMVPEALAIARRHAAGAGGRASWYDGRMLKQQVGKRLPESVAVARSVTGTGAEGAGSGNARSPRRPGEQPLGATVLH